MSTILSKQGFSSAACAQGTSRLAGDAEVVSMESLRKALLFSGILSSLLYIATTLYGGLRWEGYDIASQTVSELMAIDAPSAPFVIPLFLAYSVLIFAFGAGVWMSAGGKRGLQVAAVLIMAKEVLGIIGTLFAPMHLRGVVGSLTDTMHIVVTAVGVLLCMFPSIVLAAVALVGKFRWYSIATIVVFLGFGFLAGMDAPRIAANLPTPMAGVWERVNIFAYLLWIVVFAIRLLDHRKQSQ